MYTCIFVNVPAEKMSFKWNTNYEHQYGCFYCNPRSSNTNTILFYCNPRSSKTNKIFSLSYSVLLQEKQYGLQVSTSTLFETAAHQTWLTLAVNIIDGIPFEISNYHHYFYFMMTFKIRYNSMGVWSASQTSVFERGTLLKKRQKHLFKCFNKTIPTWDFTKLFKPLPYRVWTHYLLFQIRIDQVLRFLS